MTSAVHAWDGVLTIGGVATSWSQIATAHGVAQPVGTCRIDLPLPLPSQVVAGAPVVVTASMDGSPLSSPLFTGTFRDPDKNLSTSGNLATLLCQGPNYLLTYPFTSDQVYAGGALAAPLTLTLGVTYLHLGTQTVAWYGTHAAAGTSVDKTFTPAVDSNFLWIAGRAHGTNDYDASVSGKVTKDFSRIVVLQGGVELGRANFPVISESWSSMNDYTNDSFWSDFSLFVACGEGGIVAANGDVTIRFVSGHKPGTSDFDEYEVKAVTYQTAGKTSVRNIVRGLYARAGFAAGTYKVNEVTDLAGATCFLGGNGLVDAGQVRMVATDTPLAFANRIANLYGYWVFDSGGYIPRCAPVRGVPAGTPDATFVEGASGFSFRTYTDSTKVYNAVAVDGATGANSDGTKFAYSYATASPPANPLIPNPPGVNTLRISNTLLTSNARCQQVGQIAEVNNSDQTFVEWESWPHALTPSRPVRVTAPSAGFDGLLFLTSVQHDLSTQGFRGRFAGWRGVATPFPADDPTVDDPNPTETDRTPTNPRPTIEWKPFKPLASYNT